MPEAVQTIQRLRDELRIRVGNPDEEALGDDELTLFLETALRQMNHDDPAKKVGSFPTVVGQESYSVVPADAYRVVDVYYYPGGTDAGSVFGSEVTFSELYAQDGAYDQIGAGAKIFDNPAMVEMFHKKLTAFRRYFSGQGGQRIPADDGTLWLSPTPTAVCTVYFVYTAPRFATVALVEEYWEQPLLLYGAYLTHNSLASKQGDIVGGESAGGGSWRGGGGRMHRELAIEALTRYQREFKIRPVGPKLGR